jgi:hypothetical protein
MPIRKLVKLQFYLPVCRNLIGLVAIISAILGFIIFYTNVLPTIPHDSEDITYIMYYWTGLGNTIAFYALPSLLLIFLLDYYLYEKINNLLLNISYEDKTILLKILFHFVFKHKNKQSKYSANLALELNKLINTLENNSMIYEDLDKNDFPYLHKFLKRFKNSSASNIAHDDINDINIIQDDIDKMQTIKQPNISNPKLLLTMDHLDDELCYQINNNMMQNINK